MWWNYAFKRRRVEMSKSVDFNRPFTFSNEDRKRHYAKVARGLAADELVSEFIKYVGKNTSIHSPDGYVAEALRKEILSRLQPRVESTWEERVRAFDRRMLTQMRPRDFMSPPY